MLYHETNGNVYYVMRFLGHKKIENTMRYIHLWQSLYPLNEECVYEVASSLEEAKKLIEAGFDYMTDTNGRKLFKKRKITLVTPTAQEGLTAGGKGLSASLVLGSELRAFGTLVQIRATPL